MAQGRRKWRPAIYMWDIDIYISKNYDITILLFENKSPNLKQCSAFCKS